MTRPDGGRDRLALIATAGLTALLPLVADPVGWYVFLAVRWWILVVVAAVLTAALAVAGRVRPPTGAGWWVALVAVAAASSSLSSAPSVAWWGAADRFGGGAAWLVHGSMAMIGASVVRRSDDLRVLARGMSTGAVAVTGFVVAQRVGWSFPAGASSVRPGGPLGNADFLGAYATLAVLVTVGAALDSAERGGWRLAHAVGGLGASWCLVISGARAGWLGVVVGIVLFGLLATFRTAIPARHAAALVGLVLVVLAALGLWVGTAHRLGSLTSGTAEGRVETWERTMSVVGERPVLGWGPEGFTEGFPRSIDAAWERDYGRRLNPDRAHNGLLDVAVGTGILGLVVYVGLLARTVRGVRRASSASSAGATLVGVTSALAAYLVQQQFLFQLFDVDALAWLAAGAVAGLAPAATASARSPLAVKRSGLLVAALLAVTALVAGGDVLADRDARSSADTRSVVMAERAASGRAQTMYGLLLADAALADGSTTALGSARDRIGEISASTFDDGRLTLARARLARADGLVSSIAESEAEVRALLAVDPARSDAWKELGDLQVAQGDDASARQSFTRTVELAPRRSDAWAALAWAAFRDGDPAGALTALEQVPDLRFDPDLVRLRQQMLAGG